MEEQTGIYVTGEKGIYEKQVPLSEAIEIYKNSPSDLYSDHFFKKLQRTYSWQSAVGHTIAELYDLKSIVDFGCAIGNYLDGFHKYGAKVQGFEYLYDNAKPYVAEGIKDFVQYGNVMEEIDCGAFQAAMSVEVAEHILPEKSEIFVNNLTNAAEQMIIFTA